MKKWEDYLNRDGELKRRLAGFKTFSGLPGGHAKRAQKLRDKYKTWPKAMGEACYPHPGKSIIDGKDLIELKVLLSNSRFLHYTLSLRGKKFNIRDGAGNNPCIKIEIPVDLFRDLALTNDRLFWVLADDRCKVYCTNNLPHSDWITIFETLVCLQEIVDVDKEAKEIVENLERRD